MHNTNFIELSTVDKNALRFGHRIDTSVLENELNNHPSVREIFKGKTPQMMDQIIHNSYVPYFHTGQGSVDTSKILEIVNKYPEVKGPSAMIVNSFDELVEHAVFGFEVAFFHYILGQKHIAAGNFPKYCCGVTSGNIKVSMIKHGYPNVAYFYSSKHNHAYNALPFVMPKENINGIVGIDATSNQFWYSENQRNHVFVKFGLDWKYRIDENNGPDLFPDKVCSIDILRKNPDKILDEKYHHKGGREYLEQAYANPIHLNLEKSN